MPDKNWNVLIQCKTCSTEFRVDSVDWSKDVVGKNKRLILVTAPQQCTQCRNPRCVKEKEDGD